MNDIKEFIVHDYEKYHTEECECEPCACRELDALEESRMQVLRDLSTASWDYNFDLVKLTHKKLDAIDNRIIHLEKSLNPYFDMDEPTEETPSEKPVTMADLDNTMLKIVLKLEALEKRFNKE